MKILFDQGTPAPLRRALLGHEVSTAAEVGWAELENGSLLAAAEAQFDLIMTTDQGLRYQQNLAGRKLGILVLSTTNWPRIRSHIELVVNAVDRIRPGAFQELTIPAD